MDIDKELEALFDDPLLNVSEEEKSLFDIPQDMRKVIAKSLENKINIPFHIAEDPLHSVAKGAGIALKNVDRFSFLMR